MEWLPSAIWLIVSLLAIVYFYFQRKFSYWKNRDVPYVEPLFPLGNLPWKHSDNLKEVFEKLYKVRHGSPLVGGYFFSQPVVIATDLDFVKDVLVKDFNSFHGRGVYSNEKDDPISAHLFSLDGPKWKSLRMKLSPTFTSGKMKFMFPTIVDVSERFNQTLGKMLDEGSDFDVKELLARFTTDVIGTCAFGLECNTLNDSDTDFRKYGRMVFEGARFDSIKRTIMQVPKLAETLGLTVFDKGIRNFFLGIVRQTIEHREKNNIKRNDFMDLLIDLKNNDTFDEEKKIKLEKLTLEEAAAQAFVFFIAGFETSSTVMMFALYELALNPDIQEKLRNEINTVYAKHEGHLTYETIKDMVYLDQVINESLRKYSPAVALQRTAQEDYRVANTKLVIEKGTTVLIPVYEIHNDARYYPNPEKFDPDRFLPEVWKVRHPMSFLGFGDGPRNCIGMRFGRMQSRVGLVMLLKNYRFEVSDKTPIPIEYSRKSLVLSPSDGMNLKIVKV
ncbi:cytochrome P450 6a2-like [Hermetia illucens]|uniref:cytochrome P450 6a2-like n=1 Tax=Hermetia illucens TaxID=343691 RepID=UPI0018CC0BA5|nr:cytochrome P450 6a2-like [Hermetia illucens]